MIKKMKNVTFRISEESLNKAREKAAKEKRSLNKLINQWIKNYSATKDETFDVRRYMKRIKGEKIGRTFTREEMNER